MKMRVGMGFDVHQLKEGQEFWLGGVKLPSSKGAFGHSGYGGSCAFGDPENKIGVSYVMNRMLDNFNADGRSIELINATYECL